MLNLFVSCCSNNSSPSTCSRKNKYTSPNNLNSLYTRHSSSQCMSNKAIRPTQPCPSKYSMATLWYMIMCSSSNSQPQFSTMHLVINRQLIRWARPQANNMSQLTPRNRACCQHRSGRPCKIRVRDKEATVSSMWQWKKDLGRLIGSRIREDR